MSKEMNQEPSGLMQALGDGQLLEYLPEEKKAIMEFTVKPEFCHSGNIAQGGFVTGWIDSAMSHAVILATDRTYWPATLELKVSFFKSANPGKVKAVGWVQKMGRSIAFVEGQLLNDAGEVLATSTSTAKLAPISSNVPSDKPPIMASNQDG